MADQPDFRGFATKFGLKCADGRTIMSHAFPNVNGATVPLVWQHQHNEIENVLGHVKLLEHNEGVRAEGFFNDTPAGLAAKASVKHGDLTALSIYANQLIEKGGQVLHGVIKEVSLVLAGANPGALIDYINMAHSEDGIVDGEAFIFTGAPIELVDSSPVPAPASQHREPKPPLASLAHAGAPAPPKSPAVSKSPTPPKASADQSDPEDVAEENATTPQELLDSMTEKQRELVYAMVGQALEDAGGSAGQSDITPNNSSSTEHSDKEGSTDVGRNVFDQTDQNGGPPAASSKALLHSALPDGHVITRDDIHNLFANAQKGGSLKEAVEQFALAHGIDDISTLFPYDQPVTGTPEFISRRMAWVAGVLGGVHKTPFSRIRSWNADITLPQARAKGYVKGALKRDQFFRIAKRITTPQTVYKKQKLDRDDILDITDFDVVQWLQTEMRIMLDEELARAILIGDGRDVDDADKIMPDKVRPIYGDDELYATVVNVDLADASSTDDEIVDGVVRGMRFYYGSGNPVLFTSLPYLTRMLLIKDTLGRRIYATRQELAAALGVSDIVECQVMEEVPGLIGIVVNLTDYNVGADRGGAVSLFDFFDIDYNQFKYLMETRVSGALVKYRSALVIQEFSGAGGMLPDPTAPTFDETTGVVTIPTVTNVSYVTVADDGTESAALTPGAQTAIASGSYVTIRAKANATYEFASDAWSWTFRRD